MQRRSHVEQAEQLSAGQRLLASGAAVSERQQASELGVAGTTLQYWRQRQDRMEASAAEVAFFETAEGVALLHRLLIGAHFVITLLGCGGVRFVCQFLELTGLSTFIGASYGTQQQVNMALEAAVIAYAEQ